MTATSTGASALKAVLPLWHEQLQTWAQNGRLLAAAQEALMLQGTPKRLEQLIDQWATGNFRNIPEIVLLPNGDISGAMGAYAISTGKIYLNQDWLQGASIEQAISVLTEELGHHLDGELNDADTPGDEGEYMSRLLGGQTLDSPTRAGLQNQKDNLAVVTRGQQVVAEAAALAAIRGNSLYSIVNGPSWEQAEADSVLIGGHLVTIESEEENTFLTTSLPSPETPPSSTADTVLIRWIGLSDAEVEGAWKWVSGQPLTYSNWAPGKPDNAWGGQNYGHIYYQPGQVGEWDDVNPQPEIEYWNAEGIAEIPLTLSISRQGEVKEGAGLFTTSINLSAGTETSGNLAEGATVYWKVDGVTADDLGTGSSPLSGSGTIANGRLEIIHCLAVDTDNGDFFGMSVYSDPEMSEQIGQTTRTGVKESDPILRGNSIYKVVNGPSWTKAEIESVALGGHLATINDATENEWIRNKLLTPDYHWRSWIGITDRDTEGTWEWISGQGVEYTNWSPGEPNNLGDEDFGEILWYFNADGGWNDLADNALVEYNDFGGIAEIPVSLSITRSGEAREGAGAFTTSIKLSAGTETSGNLAEGAQIWWKITGITQDDLASGELSGSGFITNGKLDIQHSLVVDADTGEEFEVHVYSDDGLTQQISISDTTATPETYTVVEDYGAFQLVQDAQGDHYARNKQSGEASILLDWDGSTKVNAGNFPGQIFYGAERVGGRNYIAFLFTADATFVHLWDCGNGWQKQSAIDIPLATAEQWFRSDTPSASDNLIITAPGSGTLNGTPFTDTYDFNLDVGNDTIRLDESFIHPDLSPTPLELMTVDAGGDDDTFYGNSKDNILILTGINQGTLDGIAFSNVENIDLLGGDDKVYIRPGGQLTGTLNGGSNTYYLPPEIPDPTPAPQPDPNPDPIPFPTPGPEPKPPIEGGLNSFYLNDDPNILDLTGPGAGVIDGTNFVNFAAIDMRGGNDTANIAAAGSLIKVLDGGADRDTLNLNDAANTLSLTGDLTGTIKSATGPLTSIANFEVFNLAAGSDTAIVDLTKVTAALPTARQSVTINGGTDSGTNTSIDTLELTLTDADINALQTNGTLQALLDYLANPTGLTYTAALANLDLTLTGFESASLTNSLNPPPPVGNIVERSIDELSLLISGLSGPGNTTTIEKLGLVPTTTTIGRGRRARTVTVNLPGWETLETLDSIDGLTLTAGNGLNTISAAGDRTRAAKPAFNGQFIADGRLGIDVITGGSYRNWLIGGGIVTPGSETALSGLGIDILNGTTGALDVFDLRSSDGQSDAYANPNAGKALINNFTVEEDAIVLSGAETDYNVNINTVTTGTRRRPRTSTVVEIRSASTNEVIASFSGTAFSSTTTAADLNIYYDVSTTPAETMVNGELLFV